MPSTSLADLGVVEPVSLQGTPLFVTDDGIDFAGLGAQVAARVAGGSAPTFLQIGSQPVDALRTALLQEWSGGLELVHYLGHGSRLSWAEEEILRALDVATLSGPRLPIVTAMNCLNGYFIHPTTPSLGEALLLEPAGGAIAYWGPSAITSHLAQQQLALEFYEVLTSAPGVTLGEAIRAAQQAVVADPRFGPERARVHLETWVLLGDPMMRLR